MQSQTKSQSSGFASCGAEAINAVEEVDRVLDELESLYTEDSQRDVEDAVAALEDILAVGFVSTDHIAALTGAELALDEAARGVESMRFELRALRARL